MPQILGLSSALFPQGAGSMGLEGPGELAALCWGSAPAARTARQGRSSLFAPRFFYLGLGFTNLRGGLFCSFTDTNPLFLPQNKQKLNTYQPHSPHQPSTASPGGPAGAEPRPQTPEAGPREAPGSLRAPTGAVPLRLPGAGGRPEAGPSPPAGGGRARPSPPRGAPRGGAGRLAAGPARQVQLGAAKPGPPGSLVGGEGRPAALRSGREREDGRNFPPRPQRRQWAPTRCRSAPAAGRPPPPPCSSGPSACSAGGKGRLESPH